MVKILLLCRPDLRPVWRKPKPIEKASRRNDPLVEATVSVSQPLHRVPNRASISTWSFLASVEKMLLT